MFVSSGFDSEWPEVDYDDCVGENCVETSKKSEFY